MPLLLLGLALPVIVALPTVRDPFGQSESSLNAAIWALGARNIVERGPIEAKLGALVAPFHGVQDGIYAHHPPLPVWISVATVIAGGNEAVPRSIAILCVLASLLFVYRICRRETSASVAATTVLFAASLPYVLIYARLLTTLTIAAPLFLWLLHDALGKAGESRFGYWRIALASLLLVLSSWDGVLATAGVCLFAWHRRDKRLAVALLVASAAGLVIDAFYIANASGGFADLMHQAIWRSGVRDDSLTLRAFAMKQWGFLSAGLSLVGVAAIVARISSKRIEVLSSAFWVALLPGLGMTLLFRHGAQRHAFWAFNLWIAAAFALAALLTIVERMRWRALTLSGLGLCAVLNILTAREVLAREHALDEVGTFAQQDLRSFTGSPVRMLASTSFQVYIPWYLRFEIDVALSPVDFAQRLEKKWSVQDRVMADRLWLELHGCRAPASVLASSPGGRFVVATAGDLASACAPE